MVNCAYTTPFNLLNDLISQMRTDTHSGGLMCLRSYTQQAVELSRNQPELTPYRVEIIFPVCVL